MIALQLPTEKNTGNQSKNILINHEEEILIQACLNGENVASRRQAQHKLYNRYKNAMYTILCRMLNNEEDAADALQDAFIMIFRDLGKFQKKSTLGAWIKTIVVRTGIAKQKKQLRLANFDHTLNLVENESIVWDENLTGEYLEKAIKRLPDGYRNVFLLVEVEGYTHKETGELLNVSAGTSKSQLYHAKKMLQKFLKEIMD